MFRGSILDIFVIIVVLFIFTFTMLFGSAMFTEAQIRFNETDNDLGNVTDYYFTTASSSFDLMDSLTIFILVGLAIGVIVSAFFIRTHPVFFVVSLILLVFILMYSAIISNSYDQMASTDALSTEANKYTLTSSVMSNLPTLVLILSAIVIIVMFGKSYIGGEPRI